MEDIKLLDNLTEEERKVALSILKEYEEKGSSDIYDSLLLADYKEIPVDIETFLTDDRYLGIPWKDTAGKSKLYPYWLEKLKQLFPSNTTTSVNTFIASGGRGLGKTDVCVNAIMTYKLYRIMCLKDPLSFFSLKQTDKVVFAFMNIKLDLAEEIAQDKFQKTIQQSPWFLDRGIIYGRKNKVWEPNPEYKIDIKIGSQADDLIGLPVIFAFFDEISFIKNQSIDKQKAKAIDMIDTALGGMATRFIHNGINYSLLCLASSKRSDKSFLEEHIKQKLISEPDNVIIVDKAVWEIKPKGSYSDETFNVAVGNKFLNSQVLKDTDDVNEYIKKGYSIVRPPISLRAYFLDDIERALCDYAGISSTELSKYISGEAVRDCINYKRKNPFIKDIIEVGNGKEDTAQYKDFFDINQVNKDMLYKPLYVHLDMSISGDKTGISGVWIKGKKPSEDKDKQENDLFFELAFSVSIKAPKGRQISFEKNRNFIRWLRDVGFNVQTVSTDQFQSYDLRQQLEAEGFNCEMISVDRVEPNTHICLPYQFFKNVLYEQRVDMFDSSNMIEEIVNLERNINTGKVDHPSGGAKDAADSFCGAIFSASKHAEEYAYNYGESYNTLLTINDKDLSQQDYQKQMIVDFENELRKLDTMNKYNNQNKQEINQQDAFIVDDSILIW